MNIVFIILILTSFIFAAISQIWGPADSSAMLALTDSIFKSCEDSVTLAISLIGVMAFFLGLLKIAENAGILNSLSYLLRPFLVRLFPSIPADHPAMGAIIMNMAANILGLGNAATPFGIRAMQEMEKLNRQKGVASDSMILFLAINTSSVTILPTSIIALRAVSGSANPASIVPTTLFATICSTVVAILVAKAMSKKTKRVSAPFEVWHWITIATFLSIVPVFLLYGKEIAPWLIPVLVAFFVVYGFIKGVDVYSSMVDGAKQGFEVAVKIIPYLVTVLVAVGMFRSSGALDFVLQPLGALTSGIGLPAEALTTAFLRPLSGSGSYAIVASMLKDPAIGPDSYLGILVSTIMGSTETTFYVLAVYFGSVQIKKIRYALTAGLTADIVGVAASVLICGFLYS